MRNRIWIETEFWLWLFPLVLIVSLIAFSVKQTMTIRDMDNDYHRGVQVGICRGIGIGYRTCHTTAEKVIYLERVKQIAKQELIK